MKNTGLRWLIFICILGIAANSCTESSSRKIKPDLGTYDVHGKVRSIELKSFVISEPAYNADSLRPSEGYLANFNEGGLITDIVYYNRDNTILNKEIYNRDKSGALIRIIFYLKKLLFHPR